MLGPRGLLQPLSSSTGLQLAAPTVPAAHVRRRHAERTAAAASSGAGGPQQQQQPQADDDAAASPPSRDVPDRSFRQRSRLRRAIQRTNRAGVMVPSPLPTGPTSFSSPSSLDGQGVAAPAAGFDGAPGAALQQLLGSVRSQQGGEEQAQAMEDLMEQQEDEVLMQQLQSMSPEQLKEVMEAIYAPENDPEYWRQTILQPVMQDLLREELGPEQSAILDVLLQPTKEEGWTSPASSSSKAPGRGSGRWSSAPWPNAAAMRRRVSRLTDEQRERLPALLEVLARKERSLQQMGEVADVWEDAEARVVRRKNVQLQMRARRMQQRQQGQQEHIQDEQEDEKEGVEDGHVSAAVNEQQTGPSLASSSAHSQQQAAPGPSQQAQQHQQQQREEDEQQREALGRQLQEDEDRFARIRDVLVSRGFLQPTVSDTLQAHAQRHRQDMLQQLNLPPRGQQQQPPSPSSSSSSSARGGTAPSGVSASTLAAAAAAAAAGSAGARAPALDEMAGVGGGLGGARGEWSVREVAESAGLKPEVVDLVERLDAVYQRYGPGTGQGWEEEGHLGSQHMQLLKSAALTLASGARVSSAEALEEAGLTVGELTLRLEGALADVAELMDLDDDESGAAGVLDPAVRATLLYIRTQLLSDAPADSSSSGDAGPKGTPAQATQQQQQQQEEEEWQPQQGGGSRYLAVDEVTTGRLLQFIAAAEAWEALHALVRSWSARRPGILVADALKEVARVGEDNIRWWCIQEEDREQQQYGDARDGGGAGGSTESMAQMQRRLERMLGTRGSEAGRAAVEGSGALLVADEEKIEALASLDVGALRCLQELDEMQNSEEVLMKWSLHPVVGPRLSAGLPLMPPEQVHPMFKDMFDHAMGGVPLEGMDWEFRMRPSSDPMAQRVQAAQRLAALREMQEEQRREARRRSSKGGKDEEEEAVEELRARAAGAGLRRREAGGGVRGTSRAASRMADMARRRRRLGRTKGPTNE